MSPHEALFELLCNLGCIFGGIFYFGMQSRKTLYDLSAVLFLFVTIIRNNSAYLILSYSPHIWLPLPTFRLVQHVQVTCKESRVPITVGTTTWPSAIHKYQEFGTICLTLTCSSAAIHLAKCMNWSLIHVTSRIV